MTVYEIACKDCGYLAFDTNGKGACKNCGGDNLTENKKEISLLENRKNKIELLASEEKE